YARLTQQSRGWREPGRLPRVESVEMPIDPTAVGVTSEPFETSWVSKDALLYALGVGAGVDELDFTTENTAGGAQQVLPTLAVVLPAPARWGLMARLGTYDPAVVVHGEQAVEMARPSP